MSELGRIQALPKHSFIDIKHLLPFGRLKKKKLKGILLPKGYCA